MLAPWPVSSPFAVQQFQSSHSVGSGTHFHQLCKGIVGISILPLRGEWDTFPHNGVEVDAISILPLRGEWDVAATASLWYRGISILPLRGEWDEVNDRGGIDLYISILPHRGEWDQPKVTPRRKKDISILPHRGEWDCILKSTIFVSKYFNPPTPWGVGRHP